MRSMVEGAPDFALRFRCKRIVEARVHSTARGRLTPKVRPLQAGFGQNAGFSAERAAFDCDLADYCTAPYILHCNIT
jgi:hypothetical protein